MIRLERDPEFWIDIASHPAINGALMGMTPDQVAMAAQRPEITPLASGNGGYFFGAMDTLGLTVELHSLFRPAGWGREASATAKAAFCLIFRTAQIIITHQVADNVLSQPPRSFGFTAAGEFQTTAIGALRPWVLTRAAWEMSPAFRRMTLCH